MENIRLGVPVVKLPRGFSAIGDVPDGVIGVGISSSIVRTARVDSTGEVVAVKVMPRRMQPTSLSTPNEHVISVRSIMEVGDANYEILELASGGELFNAMVEREETIPAHTVLRWFAQLCTAVAHVHAQQTTYGGLRPENVLLSAGFDLKVRRPRFDLLRDRKFVPNAPSPWLPPELVAGTSHQTSQALAADVWSVGAIGLVLLSFGRYDPATAIAAPQSVSMLADCPAAVSALLVAMLAEQPHSRPSASEAAERARALAQGIAQSADIFDHAVSNRSSSSDGSFTSKEGSFIFKSNVGSFSERKTQRRGISSLTAMMKVLPRMSKRPDEPSLAPPDGPGLGGHYAVRGLRIALPLLVDAIHDAILSYEKAELEYSSAMHRFVVRLEPTVPRRTSSYSDLSPMAVRMTSAEQPEHGALTADLAITIYSCETSGYDVSVRRLWANTLRFHGFYRHMRTSLAAKFVTQHGQLSPAFLVRKLLSISHNPSRTCPPSHRKMGKLPDDMNVLHPQQMPQLYRKRAGSSGRTLGVITASPQLTGTPTWSSRSTLSSSLPNTPGPTSSSVPSTAAQFCWTSPAVASDVSQIIDQAMCSDYKMPLAPMPKDLN